MKTRGAIPGNTEMASESTQINIRKAHQFLQTFRQLVFKHFKCPICQSILKDPMILDCNHLFCQECLNGWIQVLQMKSEVKSCPVCRKLIRNLVDPTDVPSSTMGSFLRKFAQVEKALLTESPLVSSREQLVELTKALEIPYNFHNTEVIYNLTYSKYLSQKSVMTSCLDLIRQIQVSENARWKTGQKVPKNRWQKFQSNAIKTCRMICPSCLCNLALFLYEQYFVLMRRIHNSQGQWVWTRPKPVFYLLTFITIAYFYFIYLFGTSLLNHSGIKQSMKRLLQHTIFICLDIPTFELVNIIREAFLIPM